MKCLPALLLRKQLLVSWHQTTFMVKHSFFSFNSTNSSDKRCRKSSFGVQSPFFYMTGYIWFLSVRSICIELCCFGCRASCGLGPWNTRETMVKQWMIDDSEQPSFDKEWEVRGCGESKITGLDLQGSEESWIVEPSLYFVTRPTKLLVVHWFWSQQLKEWP